MEAPILETMYQQYYDQGLMILSLGFQESQTSVNSWINMFNITYPVLVDASGSTSTLFIPVSGGYLYFPHNTLLDTWQVVQYTVTGFSHSVVENLVLGLMDPIVYTSVNELSFGEVVVGESAELDFTIDNAGTGILEVTGMEASCPAISADPTTGSVYAVDDLMTVTVTYTPDHTGACDETLTIHTNDGDVIIAITGVGVASGVPNAGNSTLPAEFGMDPSYPNPFNAETVIPYRLPNGADVSIDIYSVNGRLVDKIDLGQTSAGFHRVTWSPNNATTGVYFVEFHVDGAPVNVQKILYLK